MKWWIIIITLVVLLLVTGGTATYLLLADNQNGTAEAEASPAGENDGDTAKAIVKPALYQAIEPPIIVNFKQSAGGSRYLQVGIEIMSRDQRVLDVVDDNMPAIRNNLILLLSDQEPETLHSREGKDALRASVRSAIQAVVDREAPALAQTHQDDDNSKAASDGDDIPAFGPRVEAVYFTKFVMQ